MLKKFLLALMLMPLSFNVLAANSFACTGTIKSLGLHSTDKVILSLSDMNTVVQICNLNSTVGIKYPVSAEQCKAVYSTLLAAYSMTKTISVHFDNVETGSSCSTFANWEVATARWVRLDG